jgi:UPF0755 protein
MPDIANLPKPQPINGQPSGLKSILKKSIFFKKTWIIFVVIGVIALALIGLALFAYVQLSPLGGSLTDLKKITIDPGSTSSQIGKELQGKAIIRNSLAFDIYVRLTNKNDMLKAGTYRLSPAESLPQLVAHLVKGSTDTFNITFYPGATLKDITTTPKSKKYDVTTVLENAGYSDSEISAAFAAKYNTATDLLLFAGKPPTADLEGYVYGETYNFNTGAKVEDILQATFDEFYKQIQDNNLISGFTSHGLDLFQAITLASIVQKEAGSAGYQGQVAQVFYSRLAIGMMLGSDVTYQYIADKMGVPRDPTIDSPYNTRIYPGLPPGPIATPGLSALKAVASPANGDYLYFLAGDDGIVYFAHTLAEHQANITNHCKVNCASL